MERLSALKNQVAAPVLSSYDYLDFDSLLSPEEAALRKEVRAFMETEIAPKMAPYVETATFPEFCLELFKQKGWMKHFANAPFGTGARMMMQGLMVMEMGRIDASLGTFFTVQACLAIYTV